MAYATRIELTSEERETLERWSRSPKIEQRLARRARMILAAADAELTVQIAQRLGERPSTVSKWRLRFASMRLEGLHDTPRPGPRRRYETATLEQRILKLLGEPPPAGFARWNGRLLAQALGDVPADQVWRILRGQKIQLQRKRSWCVSTDPEFAEKAADIVGLYLHPPGNALVISVDEKPAIQILERAQGYLRLANGQALRGLNHEYKRHGTTTLFGALDVLHGPVHTAHYHRRRRREFLDFMNQIVAQHPDREIHVVLDNLSSHKPKQDRWLARHTNVHFHFTPTHASWLNQIECWFSILQRQALAGASFTSPAQLRAGIDAFTKRYNENAVPFEWHKEKVYAKSPKRYIANLRK